MRDFQNATIDDDFYVFFNPNECWVNVWPHRSGCGQAFGFRHASRAQAAKELLPPIMGSYGRPLYRVHAKLKKREA